MTPTPTPPSVEFFFDPGCPWTWNTSRWLIDAAGRREIDITWRSLSLAMLKEGQEIPEKNRAAVASATAAHRVIQALLARDRNDLVGDFYTEWGRRTYHDHDDPSPDLVREVAEASGAAEFAEAIDDPSWDAATKASTADAMSLAGPDVGSPVLAFGDPQVGIFGPIVSPPPTGDDAARLLDHVLDAAQIPGFYELKRGRTGGVQCGPRP